MRSYLQKCNRNNEKFIARKGKRVAFHVGGNSSCRAHLRQHYEVYMEKCEKANIPTNHWAMPRAMWNQLEKDKEDAKKGRLTKKQQQQQLDFKMMTGPREFTRP